MMMARPSGRWHIRWLGALGALGALLATVASLVGLAWIFRPAYDTVIVNAMVYDGTGSDAFRGGVGVDGDRIVNVWRGMRSLRPRARRLLIDARGAVLTPGFIDTHSHADFDVGESGAPIRANNFTMQGVTTMIVGNCGRSRMTPRRLAEMMAIRGSRINMATLVGLNSVREAAMRDPSKSPTEKEIATMCRMVDAGMSEGAVGVSTGYPYVPGRFAAPTEIIAQLRVAQSYGGVHASHVRDESAQIVPALEEALAASHSASIPVVISHVKIAGPANCHLYEAVLDRIHQYRASAGNRGLFFDQYPYGASSTDLDLYLPSWFVDLGHGGRAEAVRTRKTQLFADWRDRLRREQFPDLGFARIASYVPKPAWQGLTVSEAATLTSNSPATLEQQFDLVLQMLDRGGAQMVYHNICGSELERIYRDLAPMAGSDSGIRSDNGTRPHPRGCGTFPRIFRRFVLQRELVRMEEAIRRMTDLPARVFRLKNRGQIAPGYYADLVIFDPELIGDRASYRRPFRRPNGILYVLVNGEVVEEPNEWRRASRPAGSAADHAGRFVARSDELERSYDGLVRSTYAPFD